jgi:hypothetical protein
MAEDPCTPEQPIGDPLGGRIGRLGVLSTIVVWLALALALALTAVILYFLWAAG